MGAFGEPVVFRREQLARRARIHPVTKKAAVLAAAAFLFGTLQRSLPLGLDIRNPAGREVADSVRGADGAGCRISVSLIADESPPKGCLTRIAFRKSCCAYATPADNI